MRRRPPRSALSLSACVLAWSGVAVLTWTTLATAAAPTRTADPMTWPVPTSAEAAARAAFLAERGLPLEPPADYRPTQSLAELIPASAPR